MNISRKDREKRFFQEEIFQALETLVKQRSLDTITMSQIAHQAGLAKGTLYNYFENKEALIIALLERHLEQFNQKILEIQKENNDFIAKLKKIVYLSLELGLSKQEFFFGILFSENLKLILNQAKIFSQKENHIKAISSFLSAAKKDGFFKEYNIEILTYTLFGLVHSWIKMIIKNKEKLNLNYLNEYSQTITDIFLNGVKK